MPGKQARDETEKETSVKRIVAVMAVLMMVMFLNKGSFADMVLGDGEIDETDLRYEGFHIGDDGNIKGVVINGSNAVVRNVTLNMYTTNAQETRIFWRKTIQLGDMAPRERRQVKESYAGASDAGGRMKVMFKVPRKANFRN